jgi:hypothetical protein
MNDPYRSTCSSCETLKAELEELRSTIFVYPSQGPDTEEMRTRCAICSDVLKWQDAGHRRDWFCKRFEHKEWVTEGSWWWKKLVIKKLNVGCPPFPHLHRTCGKCDGEWIERPYIDPVNVVGSRAT